MEDKGVEGGGKERPKMAGSSESNLLE